MWHCLYLQPVNLHNRLTGKKAGGCLAGAKGTWSGGQERGEGFRKKPWESQRAQETKGEGPVTAGWVTVSSGAIPEWDLERSLCKCVTPLSNVHNGARSMACPHRPKW